MSKALKILSRPRGNAEEYGRWSVNAFKGCSHGCLYCYLKKGVWANGLGGDTPKLKEGVVDDEHAYYLAMTEILRNREQIIKDGGLFMTFTSDPCLEETRSLFFRIAKDCIKPENNVPVTILTKCTDFLPYTIGKRDLRDEIRLTAAWTSTIGSLMANVNRDILAIGFSLTGHDELEPNASPNAERIKAIGFLHCSGYHTWASIEPVIDFPSALDMVYQALNAGCEHFKIGLLTNNTRLVRKDFEFVDHKFEAYKVSDCLHFIEDVMRMTADKATVYWKQSVRDLLGSDLEFHIDIDKHSVGKDWNMFNKYNK